MRVLIESSSLIYWGFALDSFGDTYFVDSLIVDFVALSEITQVVLIIQTTLDARRCGCSSRAQVSHWSLHWRHSGGYFEDSDGPDGTGQATTAGTLHFSTRAQICNSENEDFAELNNNDIVLMTLLSNLFKKFVQVQNTHAGIASSQRYSGIRDALIRVPNEQGIASFWRGNATNVMRYFPTQALNFAFNDLFRSRLTSEGEKKVSSCNFDSAHLFEISLIASLLVPCNTCCAY